jgi:hypothetical protein
MAGKKRPHSDLSGVSIQPCKRQTKTPKITETVKSDRPSASIASIFRTPQNAQATFAGLPAELRLQIYSHLCDSTIIHVHHHKGNEDKESRFTWTPCRSPSPSSPLLCANPKWSGMCEEEDRCTYKIYAPPEPVGFWGLAASSKSIRNETQEFFLRNTVVSIHPHDLGPWIDRVAERDSRLLNNLRRITLAGPNSYLYFSNAELQLVRNRIPNLEGLGFQCQDSIWRWVRSRANNDIQIDSDAWKRWHVTDWLKAFDPSITIAMEAMIWRKVHPRWNPNDIEQQVAIRVIRKGQDAENGSGSRSGSGWADEDVEVEVVKPGRLASKKRIAKWRQWWRGEGMKGFA